MTIYCNWTCHFSETGNSFKATADTTTRQSADNSLPDLAKALEQQLRAFYSESS